MNVGRVAGYRPDIDGLRALAVLSVVLFHAGVPFLPGGFVGVDVFFVISGYVITRSLQRDIEQRSFSIIAFYERRCRRILPALVVVVMFTMLVGALTMLPRQYKELGYSASSTLLFWSNVHFFRDLNYFSSAADWKPLLHTWSLSVEEQFYIAFPLALAILARLGRPALVFTVIAVIASSLAAAIYQNFNDPSAAFYLAPYRAWELLAGVVIALAILPACRRHSTAIALATLGLACIITPVAIYDAVEARPILASLSACLGSVLLISAGEHHDTIVKRVLSCRPLVFVGLISYSLYLWHWPVLVFIRLWLVDRTLPGTWAAVSVLLSAGLAVLSWRFVERPFRSSVAFTRRRIFALSGVSLAAATVASIFIVQLDGLPGRLSAEPSALAAAAEDTDPLRNRCRTRFGKAFEHDEACDFGGSTADAVTYVVWGDSHASALRAGIQDSMGERRGTIYWNGGCPPFLGIWKYERPEDRRCEGYNRRVLGVILSDRNIKTVFLAARWAEWTEGTQGKSDDAFAPIADAETQVTSKDENARVVKRGLKRVVKALTAGGKKVVLIGPTPEIGFDVPLTLALSSHWGREGIDSVEAAPIVARLRPAESLLQEVATMDSVALVSMIESFCASRCAILRDGRPLYSDDDHISLYAARAVAGPQIARRLARAALTAPPWTIQSTARERPASTVPWPPS